MTAGDGPDDDTVRTAVPEHGTIDSLKRQAEALKADAHLLYLAWRHPGTPWYARLVLVGILAYAVSPVELIPDFIPVIGLLDDVVVVRLGMALALRLVPAEVMAECREKARDPSGLRLPDRKWCLVPAAIAAAGCFAVCLAIILTVTLIVLLVVRS